MAGILVDVLLERLATLALDKVERELKLVVGVKQEIQNLTLKLEAIQAVLEDAEQRQVMEASVKSWLEKLNDVSFDMDDVLDEWITRVLKHQMEKQEKQSAKALVTIKKLKALPDFLWKTPLQKLHIEGSRILRDLYRQGTGEKWAKISHIPTISLN